MRILVTGADGQLGYELARGLAGRGDVVATSRRELDVADPDAIVATMRDVAPALVVNAAAYTAVDRAEAEPALAAAINARAPGVLAEEARRAGAVLIHYSTDYVFDGLAHAPYTEQDATNPLGVYGATKLAGERAIAAADADALVFRTSWVYATRGRNFLLTMQKLARERDELRVVADQRGVPNWSRTLARATATLVARGLPHLRERRGLYHLSSTGETTWHAFATAIVDAMPEPARRPRVVPITTAEYPTPARRPPMSVLSAARFGRTFGFMLPPWRDALREALSGNGDRPRAEAMPR
ncbi:MAG: dTDP-4-dehydrorhamnose reductase [Proteobacteria bacterium]|nr:dTDP-4-dehydrorhamnose reductase [Pseudomonadota bacterium]